MEFDTEAPSLFFLSQGISQRESSGDKYFVWPPLSLKAVFWQGAYNLRYKDALSDIIFMVSDIF